MKPFLTQTWTMIRENLNIKEISFLINYHLDSLTNRILPGMDDVCAYLFIKLDICNYRDNVNSVWQLLQVTFKHFVFWFSVNTFPPYDHSSLLAASVGPSLINKH